MSIKKWDVSPEELIAAIQAQPILYDTTQPEFTNKILKRKAWKEVAQHLSDDWDSLSKGQRLMRCRHVQAKWKHIRDNFRREYHVQTDKTKAVDPRRRKYRYYDDLSFLLPFVKQKQRSVCKPEPGARSSMTHEYQEDDEEEKSRSSIQISVPHEVRYMPEQMKYDTAEYDEDRAFCLSLVQSVKNMDDQNKLTAKIEILNIIRKYSYAYPQACKQSIEPNAMYTPAELFEPPISDNTSKKIISADSNPGESFIINITPKIRRMSEDDPLLTVSTTHE